jgi:hypothetical protein
VKTVKAKPEPYVANVVVVLSSLHDPSHISADRLFKELTVPFTAYQKVNVILAGANITRIIQQDIASRCTLLADYADRASSYRGMASSQERRLIVGEVDSACDSLWMLTGANPLRGVFRLNALDNVKPLAFGNCLAEFTRFAGANYDIIAMEPDSLAVALGNYWRAELPDIPVDPAEQHLQLRALLSSLETVQNPQILLLWLKGIVDGRIKFPEGLLPDSAAIALVRRLLRIGFSDAVSAIRPLMRPNDLPFRKGYFQLAITGALLAHLAHQHLRKPRIPWLRDEIEHLKANVSMSSTLSYSLLAGLLAIQMVTENDDVDDRALELDLELQNILSSIPTKKDRQLFLQFLSDSLSHVITSASELIDHLKQVLVFFKYVRDDESVLWPRKGVLSVLHDLFFPTGSTLVKT